MLIFSNILILYEQIRFAAVGGPKGADYPMLEEPLTASWAP